MKYLAVLLASFTMAAAAQELPVHMGATTQAYLVRDSMRTPIDANAQVSSGDTIEYHVQIKNNDDVRVKSLRLDVALPANIELLSVDMPYKASLDGVKFGYAPLKGNFGQGIVPIEPSYYRFLRFEMVDIAKQGSDTAVFVARVK